MKDYSVDEIRALQSRNRFQEEFLPASRIEKLLEELESGKIKVIGREGLESDAATPEIHAGMNICASCHELYWITPEYDAWHAHGRPDFDRLCTPCFDSWTREEVVEANRRLRSPKKIEGRDNRYGLN